MLIDEIKHVFNDDVKYPSDHFSNPRQSMVTEYNRFGLSLVELYCTYDKHILNARFPGDTLGHYTCLANDGAT